MILHVHIILSSVKSRRKVASGEADLGVCICGTGVGISNDKQSPRCKND